MSRSPYEPRSPIEEELALEREWLAEQRHQDREVDSIQPGVSDEYYPPDFWTWILRKPKDGD